MKKFSNILIVDSDNRSVSTLFKRSISELSESSVCITCAYSFADAQQNLEDDKFDIISLGDVIPGFQNGFFGSKLIPLIKKSTSRDAIIVLMWADERYLHELCTLCLLEGFSEEQIKGVDKNAIKNHVKLTKNFALIAITSPITQTSLEQSN